MYLCYKLVIKAMWDLNHIPSKFSAMFMKDMTLCPSNARAKYGYKQGYI